MPFGCEPCFPESNLVTDRFHVVKLVKEALQHQRIKLRWEEIEKENQAIKQAKDQGIKYKPITLENDDTPKQLLARSRYIIAKKTNDWTENQKLRAELLFKNYPHLHQAYIRVQKYLRTNLRRSSKNTVPKLDRENQRVKIK